MESADGSGCDLAQVGNQWGNLGLRFGAAYGWNNVTTSRSVAFTGYGDSLGAGYGAGTTQVFGDLGYRIDAGAVSLEPFLGLAYVNLNTNGFTEQGGDAALTSQSDVTSSTFSTLGLRASTPFSLAGVGLTANGTLGWRHAYGSITPTSTLSFGGGDSFTVAGVPIARNLAVIEAGISTPVTPDVSFGITYSGQLGGGTVDQGVSGNLDWRF